MSRDDTNTLCSAGDSLDETRSIIDRNIARLEESIRALKSRRNELSPISRLPVEILCNIFKFSLNAYRTRWPRSWTNFSQVSQHWRSSALNAPELWTNIPLNYPRWAQEMLIRSKMAKLTIRSSSRPSLDTSDPKIIEAVRLCLCEMNRIEEITFTAIPGSKLEEIFRDSPKSAPQLHTLCIRPFPSITALWIDDNFLYDTEHLQHVELLNCKISWDSRLLTGLTHLTLQDFLKANSSINQVLQALQRMPALTNLCLQDSIPDDSGGPFTYAVVNLPCLQVLNISSGVGALTAVLHHITFPHNAILNLTCNENQSTQIDFSRFLSVLATKVLSTLVIRGLSLRPADGDVTHGFNFYLWTNVLKDCFPFSRFSQPQLQLTLTWPSSQPHNYLKALTCAIDAMSLPFLTQLQISTSDCFGSPALNCIDSQTWVKTFGKLPLLEQVCVQSSSPYSFLEALVYKTKAAEKSKTAYLNVSFPKIRYIHLEGADFAATNPTITSVDMLLDCLMERCERNAEIQTLRLDDCSYISSEDFERLEEIVVDVIWDRIEQGFSDSEEELEEVDSDGNIMELDDSDLDVDSNVHWTSSSIEELLW